MNRSLFDRFRTKSAGRLFLMICLTGFIMFMHSAKTAYAGTERKSLTKKDLKSIAADFFSIKCGIPKDKLLKSKFAFNYDDDENIWIVGIITFSKPYENHEGLHAIEVNSRGDIIYWNAHGHGYIEINPDVITMGEETIPSESDAQETEVLAQLSVELKKKIGKTVSGSFHYQARFLKSDVFGKYNTEHSVWYIPVWIIYVYNDQEQLCWKAAYSYSGKLISLVPAEQDFDNYHIDGEDFVNDELEKNGDLRSRWNMTKIIRENTIHLGEITNEQIMEWMNDWMPKYRKWLQEHPYSYSIYMEAILEYYPQFRTQEFESGFHVEQ